MSLLMKELPLQERPREKFKENGVESLSDVDLLAILLRTGTKDISVRDLAMKILIELESLENLSNTSLEKLSKIHGIGEVKAITLLSALELGKRANTFIITKKKRIKTVEDILNIFQSRLEKMTQEHFIAVFLNSKNEVIQFRTIFIGSANRSIVHPRDIFKEAIKYSAVKIIVLHNHPSGDPTPSKEDAIFTNRLLKSGELLQIPLIDHIIIGAQNYYSFYDSWMK
ncbi:MAG: DNA repair protein RadC [Bacilli bacterium]|jgi:DNA repair protein RadC|nr:DNA repair protein RadC [Bacilli bacterium]